MNEKKYILKILPFYFLRIFNDVIIIFLFLMISKKCYISILEKLNYMNNKFCNPLSLSNFSRFKIYKSFSFLSFTISVHLDSL